MTTIEYELTVRQVIPSSSLSTKSERVDFEELNSENGYFYRLELNFKTSDSSMKFYIDFGFDNTEDYFENETLEENGIKQEIYVGKTCKTKPYIRYGEEQDDGRCSINIFSNLSNMIKNGSIYNSPICLNNIFSIDSYDTIISGLTYNNKKILYTDNKFSYSVDITETNKEYYINLFNEINQKIKDLFDKNNLETV